MNLQSTILAHLDDLKGTVMFQGLRVKIENPVGSTRSGKGWKVTMTHPYGEIVGTDGVDGDPVDCFLGSDPSARFVYVIHTLGKDGSFDEDKCMLGFSSPESAKAAFMGNYSSPTFFGSMDTMTLEAFKIKLKETKKDPQLIRAGGPGSGCRGDNCGRPKGTKQGTIDIRSLVSPKGIAYSTNGAMHDETAQDLGLEDSRRAMQKGWLRVLRTDVTGKTAAIEHWEDNPNTRALIGQIIHRLPASVESVVLEYWRPEHKMREYSYNLARDMYGAGSIGVGDEVWIDGRRDKGVVLKRDGDQLTIDMGRRVIVVRNELSVHRWDEGHIKGEWFG